MMEVGSYYYKWVVLMAASLTCSLTWGLAYTIGIFYISWVDQFHAGSGEVALVGGINTGISSLLGPIYDIIHKKLGYRKAGALGGVLIFVGYVGSSMALNLAMLCFFYGVVMGFGLGLSYFGASLAINNYFIRQRTLAEGVGTLGSGVGGFGFTILSQYLVEDFGWRGALLLMSGMAAHIVILFQLMFPPEELNSLRLDWISKRTMQDDGENERKARGDSFDENTDSLVSPHEKAEVTVENEKSEAWLQRCLCIFKNPVFILMLFAEFLCWTGIYVPFVHLPERARLLGIDETTVAWIASSISLSLSVSRLIIPGICDFLKVDPFYAYGVSNIIAGLVTMLSSFMKTKAGLFSYAILYGVSNLSVPLIRASTAKYLGTNAFSMAYGWVIAVNGVGLFIGPALAGLLYDITQSYDLSFYFAGGCLTVSGLLTVLRNQAIQMQNSRFTKGKAIA